MKRTTWILSALLAAAVSACGGSNQAAESPEAMPPAEAPDGNSEPNVQPHDSNQPEEPAPPSDTPPPQPTTLNDARGEDVGSLIGPSTMAYVFDKGR